MSSVKVDGRMLVKCLDEQKASWLKKRAAEHEKYRAAIEASLRTKWWQFLCPRTFEDALKPTSGFNPIPWRYKDSAPETAERSWQYKWGDIKQLADHAASVGGDVLLDEGMAYLLSYYKD